MIVRDGNTNLYLAMSNRNNHRRGEVLRKAGKQYVTGTLADRGEHKLCLDSMGLTATECKATIIDALLKQDLRLESARFKKAPSTQEAPTK